MALPTGNLLVEKEQWKNDTLLKGKQIFEAKVIRSFTSGHSVASPGRKEGTGFGVGWGPVADSIQTKARRSMG